MPKIDNNVLTIKKWLDSDGWLSTLFINFSNLKRKSLEEINNEFEEINNEIDTLKDNTSNVKSYYAVNSYEALKQQNPILTKIAVIENANSEIENGLYYHNGTMWRKFGTLA